MARDYSVIAGSLRDALGAVNDAQRRMQVFADVLWEHLQVQGVSWLGFYLKEPDGEGMVLGPHRDKPACSPIGMHGACGRVFRDNRPLVVHDVKDLGANYIACDPRDRSEVVIPLRDAEGRPYAVLDLDSHEVGSFSSSDVDGLTRLLASSGLTCDGSSQKD